jgi:hypothetical protein
VCENKIYTHKTTTNEIREQYDQTSVRSRVNRPAIDDVRRRPTPASHFAPARQLIQAHEPIFMSIDRYVCVRERERERR